MNTYLKEGNSGGDGGREQAGQVSVDDKHLHLKLNWTFNEKLYFSTLI